MENASRLFSEEMVTITLESIAIISVQRIKGSATFRVQWSHLLYLILNASQNQGRFSNLSLCILRAESVPVQKGFTWGQWDAAGLFLITGVGLGSPGSKDRSLAAMIWICVRIQTLAVVGRAAVSQLWLLTRYRGSQSQHWKSVSVNKHEANFSCFLGLVKLLFSFNLRILGLFSNTITWKITSIFKRAAATGDAKCYMII